MASQPNDGVGIWCRNPVSTGPMKTSHDVIRKVQLEVLDAVRNSVFLHLSDHFHEQNLVDEDDHGNQLIKMISKLFLRTVLHHHGRLHTERYVNKNKVSKRHQLTKTISFLGQQWAFFLLEVLHTDCERGIL